MNTRVIVVPWNFTDQSRLALDRALEMADGQTIIRVVHVAAPLSGPDNGVLYDAAEKRNCREFEARFRDQVEDDERKRKVRFHVVYGHRSREVVRFAERYNAELIVMASREQSGISSLLFRSLAEGVVRLARCPVFVYRLTAAPQPNASKLHRQPKGLPRVISKRALRTSGIGIEN